MSICTKLFRFPKHQKLFVRACSKDVKPPKPENKLKPNECEEKSKKDGPKDDPKKGGGMPKLPVPVLDETLEKFLKSSRPFLSSNEFSKSEKVVKEFGMPGGMGEVLQDKLKERGEKMENWLEDFWLKTAYLGFRHPVVVYSSPAQVFPRQEFLCEEDYIMCAAKVISGAMEYKEMAEGGKIEPEKAGDALLDMEQYSKVFGTNRNPVCPLDVLTFKKDSKHIIVAHNNHFFKMDLSKKLEIPELFFQIQTMMKNSQCMAPPVGLLTAECRDSWAEVYIELSCDCKTKESLKAIEEAAFIVCLDTVCPSPGMNNMTTTGLQVLHGGGPAMNSGNRWFDKTIQFVISRDGGVGICYEHSPAEGGVIANLMDHIVPQLEKKIPYAEPGKPYEPCELTFNLNENVKEAITRAEVNVDALVTNLDMCCFNFLQFGKDLLKELKVSPDAFIQIAIQMAFSRMHDVPGAQYETGSLRKFIRGRTETIRSCNEMSLRAVQAMADPCVPDLSKGKALRQAIDNHKKMTEEAMNMKGIDRHLLGLRLIAEECNLGKPDIYCDAAFTKSTHFRLSTSQVPSKQDGFMVYGPITEDGYGCCYNPRDCNINFGVTAYNSSPETNPVTFKETLEECLDKLKDVLCVSLPAKL